MMPAPVITDGIYRVYLHALLKGDHNTGAEILQQQISAGAGLNSVYVELMQRAMVEVGTLWETNQITVANEHLATATTELLLTRVYELLFSRPHRDRRALIACVPNELHQIGARMVADFFELNGWHGFSLGADTSAPALLRSIRLRDPDVLGLSMSLLFNLPQMRILLDAVNSEFPTLDLMLGGRAFQGDGAGRQAREQLMARYPRLSYFESLPELERYLQRG